MGKRARPFSSKGSSEALVAKILRKLFSVRPCLHPSTNQGVERARTPCELGCQNRGQAACKRCLGGLADLADLLLEGGRTVQDVTPTNDVVLLIQQWPSFLGEEERNPRCVS